MVWPECPELCRLPVLYQNDLSSRQPVVVAEEVVVPEMQVLSLLFS